MKKLINRFVKFILVPILALVFVVVTGLLGYRAWLRNSIAERRTVDEANGIEIIEEVDIGGVKQWIQVRGRNKDNPVLLFLHGGPGAGFLAMAHTYQDAWEERFTVVQWEQRAAGKSYSGETPRSSMTLERMRADTVEMVEYLRKRFDREKIFLLGHSWGSYLGIHAIRKRPEWFHAYIGVGQVVNMREGERISYEYTLRMARERGNEEALEQLSSLAPYPSENMIEKLGIQRDWLWKFGGALYRETGYMPFVAAVLSAPEYSISDIVGFLKGMQFSVDALWEPLLECDLATLGFDFQVPVFFFIGRHDYNVPADLSHDYFQKIQAPHKEFVWFENSAHSPMLEESERFAEELVDRILPTAAGTDR